MNKLPRTTPILPDEDLESYLCRLAWANGFQSANAMVSRNTPGTPTLRTLSEKTCRLLADQANVSVDDLLRFRVASGVIIPFGQSSIKRSQISLKKVRFCPHCILEDSQHEPTRGGQVYIRAPWSWSMNAFCSVHGTALVAKELTACALPSFDTLLRRVEFIDPVEPNDADVYFHSRLTSPAGDGFLDQYPAYVAAEFCAILGHIEQGWRNREIKDRIIGGYENPYMRTTGYAIAKHGRDAVWTFLTDYVKEASSWLTRPRSFYSATYHWWRMNKHNPDYRPLMILLQEHAEQNVALDRGETFFWPVLKRQVHTVRSASTEYMLSEERVTQVLTEAFGVEELPRFLKKDDIHRPLLDARSWLNTGEAASILGCSIETIDQIIKSGILTPVANKPHEARIYRLVHRTEVDSLMAKLKSMLHVGHPPIIVKPIAKLRWSGGVAAILRLLLDGALRTLTCKSAEMRLDALQIDPTELAHLPKDIAFRPADYDVDAEQIDLGAARRRLKVTKSVVDAIIASGLVPHVMIENTRQHRGHSRAWVKTSDLDRFELEHISLAEMAVERDLEPMKLLADLGRRGIRPVVQGGPKVGRFYRRDEIQNLK